MVEKHCLEARLPESSGLPAALFYLLHRLRPMKVQKQQNSHYMESGEDSE